LGLLGGLLAGFLLFITEGVAGGLSFGDYLIRNAMLLGHAPTDIPIGG